MLHQYAVRRSLRRRLPRDDSRRPESRSALPPVSVGAASRPDRSPGGADEVNEGPFQRSRSGGTGGLSASGFLTRDGRHWRTSRQCHPPRLVCDLPQMLVAADVERLVNQSRRAEDAFLEITLIGDRAVLLAKRDELAEPRIVKAVHPLAGHDG